MKQLTLKAPAKINLYLRLTGKRSDGFNNLVTVFHRLRLADELTFEPRARGFELVSEAKDIPLGDENLVARAYHLLRKNARLPGGVRIFLKKNIPAKAGLGGASSDAATTLLGLNQIFRLGLRQEALLRLGAQLGSDVPFFISEDRLSLGIDRGEKVIALDAGAACFDVVLFVFDQGLSTRDVYQNHHYSRAGINLTNIFHDVIMLALFFRRSDVSAIAKITYNDLLRPARALKPEIFTLILRLRNLGLPLVQMTGSGSTVFCLLPRRLKSRQILASFASEKHVSLIHTRSG